MASAAGLRAESPPPSGRISPGSARLKQLDEDLGKKDKSYRRYAATVERVLASFDTAIEEWADYISFLGRLQKALAARPPGSEEIAHKSLVSKRLSQCLNATLPSGVHQKSLEVYAYIFETIGKDGLARDLGIYLPGLAPALTFASLSVKPNVLAIFENFIADISAFALRPALKALILALLPGLEEENSEEFERCLQLLDRFRKAIGDVDEQHLADLKHHSDQYFWQCLFLTSVTSSSRRPGVLAYLTRRLPTLYQNIKPAVKGEDTNAEDTGNDIETRTLKNAIQSVASPEPGLLIRCFCAGLQDEQILVQRGFLDLLLTHVPLNSPVLQTLASEEDLQILIGAATAVVARRDMSLNRRLWSWFLGPEPAPESSAKATFSPTSPEAPRAFTPRHDTHVTQIRYFENYGLPALTACMKEMIDSESKDPTTRARPLRICLSLMDKWDIGALVVPPLFLRALRSAWRYQSLPVSNEASQEVLKSANMFFDAVESGTIWAELQKLMLQALEPPDKNDFASTEMLEFVLFILNKFNIREEEMQIIHMPLVAVFSLFRLLSRVQHSGADGQAADVEVLVQTLQILHKLLELIPPRALKSESQNFSDPQPGELTEEEIQSVLTNISTFYSQEQGNVDVRRPLKERQIGRYLLSSTLRLTSEILQLSPYSTQTAVDLTISLLGQILRKGLPKDPAVYGLMHDFQNDLDSNLNVIDTDEQFRITLAKISVLEVLFGTPHSINWVPARLLRHLVGELTKRLWPRLSPAQLKSNVEAARALWKLHSISTDAQLVESTIVTLMLSDSGNVSDSIGLEDSRRFEVLWTHSPVTSVTSDHRRASSTSRIKLDALRAGKGTSELLLLERPLMIMLDALRTPRSPFSQFVTNWLQSLPSLLPIVKSLISRIHTSSALVTVSQTSRGKLDANPDDEDWNTYLYYLQTMLNLVQSAPEYIWNALSKNNSIKGAEDEAKTTYNDYLVQTCLSILRLQNNTGSDKDSTSIKLKQCALTLLDQILTGPLSENLRDREIELCLLQELKKAVEGSQHTLQISIMEVTFSALKLCLAGRRFVPGPSEEGEQKTESPKQPPDLRVVTTDLRKNATPQPSPLPSLLLDCLELGLRSTNARPALENWIAFLGHCLPLYQHSIFQVLLPLVRCFCETLDEVLGHLKEIFSTAQKDGGDISEPTIALLLTGTEQTLATAHDQLAMEEAKATPIKVPEQPTSGFFGGMVSGVFNAEALRSKSSTGNKRLTVLLCFKDAIRMCFKIWSWGDSGKDSSLRDMSAAQSFSYITLRLRNRTRRLFEHLFAVEPLECLETLVDFWQGFAKEDNFAGTSAVLHLLNALESSRPKNTIPAIFNAIYSRTNPTALENGRKSSLTSDIADASLASFLVSYATSLEDDAMDEIWTDCVTFLRDVLANPMPHRQTLAKLLEFTAILGIKVDNTNFGEQRKMRRELGDLFNRLLAATLTIRPLASWPDEKSNAAASSRVSLENRTVLGDESLVSVLAAIASNLPKVLVDSDRLAATVTTISTQVIGPIVKSKTFPENVSNRTFDLLKAFSNIPEATKPFKKDLGDAFNDDRFFSTPLELAKDGWLPLLKATAVGDKERMSDLIGRLPYPSSAGVLGIGASSARTAADHNTQLSLRRIALLILAAGKDSFVGNLATLQSKLFDLLAASSSSSPSSTTRAEVYMVIRAIALRTSSVHISSFWPTVNSELTEALTSVQPSATDEVLTPVCLLHACKLLDLLVALGFDDFQLQEWLFISDTTDALYRPQDTESVALADNLTESWDARDGSNVDSTTIHLTASASERKRKPLLATVFTREMSSEKILERIIRPFLRLLSIQAFESNYSMHPLDEEICADDLLADIFDDRSIV